MFYQRLNSDKSASIAATVLACCTMQADHRAESREPGARGRGRIPSHAFDRYPQRVTLLPVTGKYRGATDAAFPTQQQAYPPCEHRIPAPLSVESSLQSPHNTQPTRITNSRRKATAADSAPCELLSFRPKTM